MLDIRLMRPEDVAFGQELVRLAGWNQTEADWRRLLELESGGVFVAEQDGTPCGTASAVVFGRRTAWIGMVLVHPDFRRQGIGSALMTRCIHTLQGRRVESIKLDATDQGRPVYLKLGFRDERAICRLAGPRPADLAPQAGVRPIAATDWPAVARLDLEAFGADRQGLLERLADGAVAMVLVREGELRAAGWARPGREADYLGPLVAADAESAEAVARALLARLKAERVYWDVLDDNAAARELAESLGLGVDRRLTRMVLGAKMNSGRVDLVYGTAGFELG